MKQARETRHIAVEGEMNIYRIAELREQWLAAFTADSEVEIDLSRVTEIDASGLQLMLAAKLESILRDVELRFTGHSPAVQEAIDLTDLGSFFGDPMVIAFSKH